MISPATIKKCLVALMLFGGTVSGWAQYRDWVGIEEESTTSRWVPRLKYLQVDTDAERDVFNSSTGRQTETTHMYVSPRIGIEWKNYIYHPYLLSYTAILEPGYMWRRTSISSSPSLQTEEFILAGKLNATILSAKPYSSTVSYNRSREDVRYGFFNSATVDSETWGASTGYRAGLIPFTVSFSHANEDSDELTQRTISEQSVIDLEAKNERNDGDNTTDLTFQHAEFNRTIESSSHRFLSENNYNRLALSDTENFDRSVLRSTLRYTTRESQTSSDSSLDTAANYDLDLTDRLRNFYQGSFSQFSGNSYDSTQTYGTAGLRHQLYESLSSTLELHASRFDSSAGPSSFASTSGGISLGEDYTKHLGSWGRLSIGNGANYNFTEQEESGGSSLIANEAYTVPPTEVVRLTHTRAITILSVTDSNNIPLQAGLDYTVNQSTEPWQIVINTFGPSHIQPGAVIFVTYTIQQNASGNYSTFGDQIQIRLSFWGEMASIYARYGFSDNHASSPNLLVQNESSFQAGADFHWHGLSLSGDYSIQRSTLYNYESINLGENYITEVTSDSTVGVTLNQQWAVNSPGSGPSTIARQKTAFYNFMLTYEWHPLARLTWRSEIGFQRQTGFGLDQNLFGGRTSVNWMIGKIQMSLGYEHQNQDFLRESRERDYVFLKLRRNF